MRKPIKLRLQQNAMKARNLTHGKVRENRQKATITQRRIVALILHFQKGYDSKQIARWFGWPEEKVAEFLQAATPLKES